LMTRHVVRPLTRRDVRENSRLHAGLEGVGGVVEIGKTLLVLRRIAGMASQGTCRSKMLHTQLLRRHRQPRVLGQLQVAQALVQRLVAWEPLHAFIQLLAEILHLHTTAISYNK